MVDPLAWKPICGKGPWGREGGRCKRPAGPQRINSRENKNNNKKLDLLGIQHERNEQEGLKGRGHPKRKKLKESGLGARGRLGERVEVDDVRRPPNQTQRVSIDQQLSMRSNKILGFTGVGEAHR